MIKRTILLAVVGLAVTWPSWASASLCFRNEFGEVYVLDITGVGGPFFQLAGEWVIGGTGGGGGHPFTGSAHFLPPTLGTVGGLPPVHFSLILGAANGPQVLEGTLNPPSYTSGTATERSLVGTESTFSRTLSPAACPPLTD